MLRETGLDARAPSVPQISGPSGRLGGSPSRWFPARTEAREKGRDQTEGERTQLGGRSKSLERGGATAWEGKAQ